MRVWLPPTVLLATLTDAFAGVKASDSVASIGDEVARLPAAALRRAGVGDSAVGASG